MCFYEYIFVNKPYKWMITESKPRFFAENETEDKNQTSAIYYSNFFGLNTSEDGLIHLYEDNTPSDVCALVMVTVFCENKSGSTVQNINR